MKMMDIRTWSYNDLRGHAARSPFFSVRAVRGESPQLHVRADRAQTELGIESTTRGSHCSSTGAGAGAVGSCIRATVDGGHAMHHVHRRRHYSSGVDDACLSLECMAIQPTLDGLPTRRRLLSCLTLRASH